MLHAEAESEIQQRIAALPSPLRETFDLHILQAIPAKTVASQLGISPANVRKHAQLARARLRRDLQRCHEGEGHPGRTEDQPRSAPPVELPCRRAKPPQVIPSISIIRTVRVKLPCGVEQLHHVLPPTAPVSPGRRIRSLIVYVQRHPGSWRSRLKLAELFHITGEWNKAVVQWRHVLARRPDLLASLKLGDTLLKLGAPEVAEEVFRLARRQDFQSEATGLHLEGWIAFCQKDNSRSVTQFQAAADIEPENPVHWHGLALARHLAGTAEEALTAIRRALHLNPNDLAACRTFGEDFLK
jgi:tetratricopeptide (TPR) repeat protein